LGDTHLGFPFRCATDASTKRRRRLSPFPTLTLLAAGTGLRISECLALQWHDVNFADGMIHVRRTWTCGQVGLPKSKASKGPVPLHPLLADFMRLWKQKTTYSQAGDWVFPSTRLNGKQPRVANMLVEDHLRPAAVKAGILSSHPDNHGGLVDDDPRRFGFHNLRHSLASFLIRIKTDPKTVQTLLRHSDVKLTLQVQDMVARDGVEPPTPAFSGLRSTT
jgi:integrase